MENLVSEYLEQVKVGRKQSFKNLAVYPLLSTYSVPLDYLTLDEALTGNVLDIVEVDKDGSVSDLKVKNNSAQMILILDGEELVGAKQNRIVNTTILVAANTTLIIPVSCVEHGRWSYESTKFSSQERMMSSNLRAMIRVQYGTASPKKQTGWMRPPPQAPCPVSMRKRCLRSVNTQNISG